MARKKSKSISSYEQATRSKLQRDSIPFVETNQESNEPMESSFDTPLYSPNFQIASILPRDLWLKTLLLFIKSELNIMDVGDGVNNTVDGVNNTVDGVNNTVDGVEEQSLLQNDYRTDRILNLLKVPLKLEIFSWFGNWN